MIAKQSEPINLPGFGLALEAHDIVANKPGSVWFFCKLSPTPVAERLKPSKQLLVGEDFPMVPEAELIGPLRQKHIGAIPLSDSISEELAQAILLFSDWNRVIEECATCTVESGKDENASL